jgi:6-phosphogluconolactonase
MTDPIVEFHIGSYSHDLGGMTANGEGIYSASINLQTGALTNPRCVARCINPSYLAWGPGRSRLYATQETFAADRAALVCFGTDDGQQLQLLQKVYLQGELPCHVSIDATGRFLTSAQYGGGNIALFKLADDGEIIEPAQIITHSGKGSNEDRQEGPHAHYAEVLSQEGLLIAVDLGLDRVFAYEIDSTTEHVTELPAFSLQTTAGAGPRHLAMLPGSNTAYLYCELNDEIYQLTLDARGFECVGTVRAFDHSRAGGSAGAAIKIAPDQRHLYVSGRTQSQIASFEIDQNSKQLTALACIDTGGICPRDFSITPEGAFLVVANEHSNNITSLRRDLASGLLEPTGYGLAMGSPVCILF